MPAEDSSKLSVSKDALIALLSELSKEDLQKVFEESSTRQDWKEYIINQYEENFLE